MKKPKTKSLKASNVQMTVYVPQKVKERLVIQALKRGMTLSAFVLEILEK